eukprot:TRINITY_DN7533_c0_g1_i2.p1 TRINITY_DN7533_c0_g1~~TRINITY_DN7533_c0_g1_i2.p1  ORF type:complete len:227 (+),score=40.82 TRINITY_DN7533_c0_g1_i2:80-760(+)
MAEVYYPSQKVLVLGNSAVGKSSLIGRYVENTFDSKYLTTLGADMVLKTLTIKDGATMNLRIWDIAGQDRFSTLTRPYYKDAQAAMLVFDLTKRTSFVETERWRLELVNKVFKPNGEPVPILLVGNKSDLKDQRQISRPEIEQACQRDGIFDYRECSAKSGDGVSEAFECIANKLLETLEPIIEEPFGVGVADTSTGGSTTTPYEPRSTIKLREVVAQQEESKCWC